jgi:hypothetical protein
VVGLVEDQQRAGPEIAQPVAQGTGIRLVDQQPVRDEEAGVRGPGVGAVAAFAADANHIVLVEHLEAQSEALLQLVLPLRQDGRRAGHDDVAHLLPQQQFAGDEPGLDGLAQANVIGDEQVHARQEQRLAQGFDLVGVDANAGAEGGLEEPGIGGRDAVPAQRMQVGGEQPGRIEATGR